jgi:hypothetical protein
MTIEKVNRQFQFGKKERARQGRMVKKEIP